LQFSVDHTVRCGVHCRNSKLTEKSKNKTDLHKKSSKKMIVQIDRNSWA